MRWPGSTPGRGVAARRARDPVVEVARRQRDVARRAGRAAGRVDADDLVAARAQVRADRVLRRHRRPQLLLLGQRQAPMSSRPPRRGGGDAGGAELLAVEGRALEQVGDLLAVGRVVDRALLLPRPRLDLGREDHDSSASRLRLVVDRLLGGAAIRNPIGCCCSSARWASRPAVRARIGTALTAAAGSRGRASRPRSASRRSSSAAGPRPRRRRRGARARARRAARSRRARRRARGCARRAGRAGGGPGGRSPGSLPPAARMPCAISLATAAGASPARPARCASLEQPRALLGRAEDHRAAAEDPRRDGALQRARVGGERHPRGDVRRHHPVLGDRDEQQVEEVALVLGRLVAGEQQVEVLGEASAGP